MFQLILLLLLCTHHTGTHAFFLGPPSSSPPPPPTHRHAHRTNNDDTSRAGALQQASSLLLPFLFLTTPSHPAAAAVPTLQEYYGNEGGARPKTNNYIVSSKKEKKDTTAAAEDSSGPPPDPQQLLASQVDALNQLIPFIKQEGWDAVLAATKKKPLSYLFTPYLGYGGLAGLSKAVGGDKGKAKNLEEARQEAAVSLGQLVDYAFSNRVVFFNSLDKQQVAALASGRAPPDLSEALGYVSDTVGLVKGLGSGL